MMDVWCATVWTFSLYMSEKNLKLNLMSTYPWSEVFFRNISGKKNGAVSREFQLSDPKLIYFRENTCIFQPFWRFIESNSLHAKQKNDCCFYWIYFSNILHTKYHPKKISPTTLPKRFLKSTLHQTEQKKSSWLQWPAPREAIIRIIISSEGFVPTLRKKVSQLQSCKKAEKIPFFTWPLNSRFLPPHLFPSQFFF